MSIDWEIQRDSLGNLSEIDRRILRMVAQGRSSKEIGKALSRSPLTIDGRLKEVCLKLGADNRVQAASMLLLDEAFPPPKSGGSQDAGIDSEAGESRVGDGRNERSSKSAMASPSRAGRDGSSVRSAVRSMLLGKVSASESSAERLIRVIRAILLATVALALVFFFLASALQAFQDVFMGIRS